MEEYLPPLFGKRRIKLLFELEKKESKKLKSCQKLVEYMHKSPRYNQQTEPERCKSEIEVYMSLPKPGNLPFISKNTGAMQQIKTL